VPLKLLSSIREPTLVLDDRAVVVGMNSAAVEQVCPDRAPGIGRSCFEVVKATDSATGMPCVTGCPVGQAFDGSWMATRRLSGLGSPGHTSCALVRAAVGGNPVTLAVLEPEAWSSESGAALADEITTRVLPALLETGDPAGAALAVLTSALRVTAAQAGEVRLVDGPAGALVRSAAIGDPVRWQPVLDSPADHDAQAVASLRSGRMVISRVGGPTDAGQAGGGAWAITAPVHCDSRFIGALTVVGEPPALSIPRAARVLRSLAGHLGLFMRWLPGTAVSVRMRIRALGGFSVELDGRPLTPAAFRRRSSLALLKLLTAADGQALSRAELAASLWPGAPARKAMANLRAVLHSACEDFDQPRGRPAVLNVDRHLVGLEKATVWVDSVEFQRGRASFLDLALLGRRQQAIRAATDALALYHGPFLGDECGDDRSLGERTRLHELFVDLSVRLARQMALAGDPEAAEITIGSALALDPDREELQVARASLEAARASRRPAS
jgi:DNA-binding SARP family transcriptional activator